MVERIAMLIVAAFYLYASIGLVFSLSFVTIGVKRVDAQAVASGMGFRILILPGCVAFWPLLLRRWMAGSGEPPEERNPHR